MPFGDYLHEVDDVLTGLESFIARVESGDLRVTRRLEKEARGILHDLQAEARFRRQAGVLQFDPTNPETRRALDRARRRLDQWRDDAKATLGSDAVAQQHFLAGRLVLTEMDRIADRMAIAWEKVIRRLSNQSKFTAQQVAEAKQLSKDTAFYRRQFGSVKEYLHRQGSRASFGKAENMAAEVDRVYRHAYNFLGDLDAGPQLFRVEEASAQEIGNAATTLRFNLNNLSLSATAHARGLVSACLIALAQPLGVVHFMHYVTEASRDRVSGLTAELLFQVRVGEPGASAITVRAWAERVGTVLGRSGTEVLAEARSKAGVGDPPPSVLRERISRILVAAEPIAGWTEVVERVNRGRVSTVAWGGPLTLRHNSPEFFVPIPPSLVAESREWSRQARGESRRAA